MLNWIFIYGPPCVGKSSLARQLAQALQLPLHDLDALIEAQAGQAIPEIFAAEGESGFRQRESAVLQDVLANRLPGVTALGGGALLDVGNRACVEAAGPVLCLDAPYEVLLGRAPAGAGQRPLLHGDAASRLHGLLEQRSAHYASFALHLDASSAALDALAWQAQVRLGMFRVSGMGSGYDVRVRPGGLDGLGHALRQRGLKGPVALVSDENVAPLHADRALDTLQQAGYTVRLVTIPAGEAHKTVATVMHLWEAFLEIGLERSSTVVALGGGVVGDLAGFAAATYLRGVAWVAVPTSLLAMVDASLGGKTGADLPQGKNLVGAFHPPSLVLADPHVLSTLPEIELRNGMAEVVKNAIIADPELFAMCRVGWGSLQVSWEPVVRRSMAAKIGVIQADPFEKGSRAALNLGHTLGHALELASDLRLRHGEAVAIGMVAAARMAEEIHIAGAGLAAEIAAVLHGLGLPTEPPAGLSQERIQVAMGMDKKRSGGKSHWVLPVRIGEVRWNIEY